MIKKLSNIERNQLNSDIILKMHKIDSKSNEYNELAKTLIDLNGGLVRRLTDIYARGLDLPKEEIIHEANASMIMASDTFDENKNVAFGSYFSNAFLYKISKLKREELFVSGLQRITSQINKAYAELIRGGSFNPTVDEIAKKLDTNPKIVSKALIARKLIYLDQPVANQDSTEDTSFIDSLSAIDNVEETVLNKSENKILNLVINTLPLKDRQVLQSFYFDEKSMRIIAKELDCSSQTVANRIAVAHEDIKHTFENKEIMNAIRVQDKLQTKYYAYLKAVNKTPTLQNLFIGENTSLATFCDLINLTLKKHLTKYPKIVSQMPASEYINCLDNKESKIIVDACILNKPLEKLATEENCTSGEIVKTLLKSTTELKSRLSSTKTSACSYTK